MMQRETMPKSEPTMQELEDGLRFNPLNLDEALEFHTELFYRAAKAFAIALADRDTAKLELTEVEAAVAQRIRDDYRDSKITVSEIEAQITLDPAVRQKRSKVNTMVARHAGLQALRDAYVQRGYAIRDTIESRGRAGSIDAEVDRHYTREMSARSRSRNDERAV